MISLDDTALLDPFVVSSQKNPTKEVEVKLDGCVLAMFSFSTELNLSILS